MTKVLIFTLVEKLRTKKFYVKDGELTPSIQNAIQKTYGIDKEWMSHRELYGSEAMNGDILYIEVVSEDNEALDKMYESLKNAKIKFRYDLHEWVKKENLNVIKTTPTSGMYDAYLVEME